MTQVRRGKRCLRPDLVFLAAAALLGVLFVLRERRARQPLLPLKLFRSASLSAGVVLVILLMFAMFGAMFFMTFYLENVHGLDPINAGRAPATDDRDADYRRPALRSA